MKLALSGLLILVVASLAFMWIATARTETGPELLGPENWPVTVEETVHDLLPRLSLLEKLRFMLMKK
ncbi:hypothetical protein AAFG13_12610 [Bradyrhizobium sp. B124]|uniref:hypothetical protein n=1 Tax=Bradyrhizobium sp. B124 TaxID=3140245 RepID=UPI0031841416